MVLEKQAKKDVHARLTIIEGPGRCHFPLESTQGFGIDFFKGLTAEVKVKKMTSKGEKIEWQVLSGRRNEPLDLFNYATAAIEFLPIDLNDDEYKGE